MQQYPFPERGSRLIGIMAKKGIGTRELARHIDVSPSTVSGWRKGAEMREGHIMNVCALLHISTDELLKPGHRTPAIHQLTEQQLNALELLLQLLKH